MDWTLCIVCQKSTHEPLRCPLNADGFEENSEPYKSFLDNVNSFRELNQLPVPLPFDEASNVEQFARHRAQWHKSCHFKFGADKLERARKRARASFSETCAAAEKRQRREPLDNSACLFCGKSDGRLHNYESLDADENLKVKATELGDTELSSRLAGGDVIALEAKYHLTCLTGFRN